MIRDGPDKHETPRDEVMAEHKNFGRTLDHLLDIDPDTVVRTPANRPV